jgi:uncharacterized protein (DUF362 family)
LHDPTLGYIASGINRYPENPSYSPPEAYPETIFSDTGDNSIYTVIRSLFLKMGLDKENAKTAAWSPFRDLAPEGGRVIIKPNLVAHGEDLDDRKFSSLVTHASILRPIIDYALKAVGNKGTVIVADGPLESADFLKTCERSGLSSLLSWYRKQGITIPLFDLRNEKLVTIHNVTIGTWRFKIMKMQRNSGDPLGYALVDLADKSSFSDLDDVSLQALRSTQSVRSKKGPIRYHMNGHHAFPVAKTLLNADCVISVPKLKTHKHLGVTLSTKNLVGIIIPRSYLPHFREGMPPIGDEFNIRSRPLEYALSQLWKRMTFGGFLRFHITNKMPQDIRKHISFVTNDTIWRTALDLNKCLFFADGNGELHSTPTKSYFSVVDGIIAGEYDGPLNPTPKETGLIIAGTNPLDVDEMCIRLMGFNPNAIKLITEGRKDDLLSKIPSCSVIINSNDIVKFVPPEGWDVLVES